MHRNVANIPRQAMESLREFLENSTIHGLCHISTSRSRRPYLQYIQYPISNIQYPISNLQYPIHVFNLCNLSNFCHLSNLCHISNIRLISASTRDKIKYPKYQIYATQPIHANIVANIFFLTVIFLRRNITVYYN